jgi:hypothetical protein
MDNDLTGLLDDWQYNPEDNVRIIKANDGRKVLQVRLPLGIEQYELDGRPDGLVPFGKDTMLEEYSERLKAHIKEEASDEGFSLDSEDCALLQSEGVLFYFRYLLLFQLKDYERVERDTEHNLSICDLIDKYGMKEEDKNLMLQYYPYILRMNAVAKAMSSVENHVQEQAREIIEGTISRIMNLADIDSPAFRLERIRSVNYLKSVLKQIENESTDPKTSLKEELNKAVAEEDYEEAAKIRDRLKRMNDE